LQEHMLYLITNLSYCKILFKWRCSDAYTSHKRAGMKRPLNSVCLLTVKSGLWYLDVTTEETHT